MTTYTVIDTQTGRTIARRADGEAAQDKAERMNAVFGAARYVVRLVLEGSK